MHKVNTLFEYLYRDAGNNKNWERVVFSNPTNLSERDIDRRLRSALIEGTYFFAASLNLPDLHFAEYNDDLDHTWHEYFDVTPTDGPQTDPRTIEQFLREVDECQLRQRFI